MRNARLEKSVVYVHLRQFLHIASFFPNLDHVIFSQFFQQNKILLQLVLFILFINYMVRDKQLELKRYKCCSVNCSSILMVNKWNSKPNSHLLDLGCDLALIYQKKQYYLLYNHLQYHIVFHYHDSETFLQKQSNAEGG